MTLSEPDAEVRSKRESEINKIVYTTFETQKICFGNQDSFVVEFPYTFWNDFGELMEKKAATLNHTNIHIEDDGSRMIPSFLSQ